MRLETVVEAQPRAGRGKNEARRTRREGLIPAVVYGAFKDPLAVSVNPKDVIRIIHSRTGHNSIFDLNIDGIERTPVIVADEQYDPIKGNLLHLDFKRIDLSKKLRVSVPIRATGEARGVKQQGGVLDLVTRAVEIECVPDDIPNEFAVDVSELTIGTNIRVSDLKVKEGIRVLTSPDAVIAHVVGIREEAAAPAEAAPAAPAEPEVVKKGKKEEEAAPAAGAEKGKKK